MVRENAVYPVNWMMSILSFILAGLSAFLFGFMVRIHFFPLHAREPSQEMILGGMAVFGCFALVMFVCAYFQSGIDYVVTVEGLLRRHHGRKKIFRWEEMATFAEEWEVRDAEYKLTMLDGRVLRFRGGGMQGVLGHEELAEAIKTILAEPVDVREALRFEVEQARVRANGADVNSPVGVYHAKGKEVPPEVASWGSPEQIHRPWFFVAWANRYPWLFGSVALAGIVKLLLLWGTLPVWIALPALVILFGVLVMPISVVMQRTRGIAAEYWFFREALVRVNGAEYVVVPWDEITTITHKGYITSDGKHWEISGARDELALLRAMEQRVASRLLDEARALIDAGETVVCGQLRLNRKGLTWKSQHIPWKRVSEIKIVTTMVVGQGTSVNLVIKEQGKGFLWAKVNLRTLPNSFVAREVIRWVSPHCLLVENTSE